MPIRVLYVEDEPFLGKIVKESLESRGFLLHWVQDGAAVMDAFLDCQPNICILDVMLPNRDGFSIGKEIRKHSPELPIIFLSAKDQTEDVLHGFSSGGNDYLRKPFSQEELIVRIHNLVSLTQGKSEDKDSPADPAVHLLGKYSFYPEKQSLIDPNHQVRQLSYRESRLLSLLCAKPNAVIQRKDILIELWGNDSFFNSRNLDVYIAKMRDYFKADSGIQILTLKGVGYRFVCT
jgi:two-component system, OmpR family, response regulator VicR